MPKQIFTTYDFVNTGRITGLPDAVGDQEPATLAQLKSQIEGLAWKDSARVKTQGNINLAAPGATVDGITMASGDRVLVTNQTSVPENGVYIWNGAATPATRALDLNSFAELEAAVISVEEGTNAGTTWRQTQINGTIGSSDVVWANFASVSPPASETVAGLTEKATQAEVDAGTAGNLFVSPEYLATWSNRTKRFSQAVGDGSATSYAITHNLGTRDVVVSLYRNSGNYDEVECEVRKTTVNQITLIFSVPPTSNQFQVAIIG